MHAFVLLWAVAGVAWGRSVPDEVIVRFTPGTSPAAATRAIDELGGRELGELRGLGFKRVKLPPGLTPLAAISRLTARPDVASAEPNVILRALGLPNDPQLVPPPPYQWHLYQIHATDAWAANIPGSQGTASVVIGIIDSGLYTGHEEYTTGPSKVAPGYNAINPGQPTTDDCGHGTWVASIAAAPTNNLKGGAGVAWLPLIMPVKALSYDPSVNNCTGTEFDIDQGILWAAANGAKVINMSIGGDTRSDAEAATMQSAWSSGCVLVAAAGNTGDSAPSYPAAYPNVLAVASTDHNDQRSSFSSYGPDIALAAPGEMILVPDTAGPSAYASVSGTSMASPIVAGLAAVLLGQDPARTHDDIVRILEQTADHLGDGAPGVRNDLYGYGRVNMYRALTGQNTPPPALKDNGYAFPNPFSPTIDRVTTFVVRSAAGQAVSVEIFDALGTPVWRKAFSAQETAGVDFYYHSPMTWDGRDTHGRDMANGVYQAVIAVGSSRTIKHIVVAR